MGENTPTEAPQVSILVQVETDATTVPADIFTGTLQGIIGFTNIQVQFLVDDGYDSQELVLYWEFTYIK